MDISRKTWIIIGIVVGLLLIGLLAIPFLGGTEDIDRIKAEVRMGMTVVEVKEIAKIRPLFDRQMDRFHDLGYSQRGNTIRISFTDGKARSMRYVPSNSEMIWIFSEKQDIPDADGTVTLPDDPNASSQPGW